VFCAGLVFVTKTVWLRPAQEAIATPLGVATQRLGTTVLEYCGKRDGSAMSCIQSTKINTSSEKVNYQYRVKIFLKIKFSLFIPNVCRPFAIQCGNYLWNKFNNFKINDIFRKGGNRSIFISRNTYFKLLHLPMTLSIFELLRSSPSPLPKL
jgi:hypothetical protein